MPSVPRYSNPQVQQSVGPAIRQSAEASPDVFGAGKGFERTASLVTEIAQRAKDNADQVAVNDGLNQLTGFRTQLEYDPNAGYYNKRGKDAIDGTTGVPEVWGKKGPRDRV